MNNQEQTPNLQQATTAETSLTRRHLLQRTLALGLVAGSGWVLAACGRSSRAPEEVPAARGDDAQQTAAACGVDGNASLADSVQVRALQYVDQSPNPNQTCSNCRLFHREGEAAGCGKCDALPILVAEGGYCRAWTAA